MWFMLICWRVVNGQRQPINTWIHTILKHYTTQSTLCKCRAVTISWITAVVEEKKKGLSGQMSLNAKKTEKKLFLFSPFTNQSFQSFFEQQYQTFTGCSFFKVMIFCLSLLFMSKSVVFKFWTVRWTKSSTLKTSLWGLVMGIFHNFD